MYSQYSWGGVPRRIPEPGGMCANTYTHVPVCAGTIHTHPRVPALSFPWLQLGHRAVAPRLSEPQLWPYSVSARHLPPSPACHVQLCLEGRGCLSAPRGGQTKEASEVGASTTHTAFLFLQRLMEKHSPQARPDPALASASEQERPQVCRVLEPTTSRSTETTSPRWGPGWSWPQPPDVAEARPAGWVGAGGRYHLQHFPPTDHNQPGAETRPHPPRVPRKDSRVRRTSPLLQVRVLETCTQQVPEPVRAWGRQRGQFQTCTPSACRRALPGLPLPFPGRHLPYTV